MGIDKEKRNLLCDLAELYLDTKENSYISINDGIMNSNDSDSISFLILLALTYSKDEIKTIYSLDFDMDLEKQQFFIEKEYKKIVNSSNDKIVLGKMILDDAKEYYNDNFSFLDSLNIDETIVNNIHI